MSLDCFQAQFDVSADVMERLIIYHDLLIKWQKAINLVGPKTVDDAWQRHFADSAQLLPHMMLTQKIVFDLGSGAGFPGLVLAMMDTTLDVHLIESDERKAQFLRTVSRETGIAVHVHCTRIEHLDVDVVPDVITSRALSHLDDLIKYSMAWACQNPALLLLFLKGEAALEEVEVAKAKYDFSLKMKNSLTHDEAKIMLITDVKHRQ